MSPPVLYPIDEVVPHRGAMRLVDRVLAWDETTLVAELVVPQAGLFVDGGGVPAWIGIEYMAQAIAAWAGSRARRDGRPPGIGFLLGSRRYTCERALFPSGTRLQVRAHCELLGDNGLGMFACVIEADGQTWASANVSVFQPTDAAAYLESGKA